MNCAENCVALTSAPHGSQYVEDESLEESEESSPGAPRTAAIRQAKRAERSIAEEFILSELLDYRSEVEEGHSQNRRAAVKTW